jgi:hypothetical protein
MATGYLAPLGVQKFFDNNGNPLALGLVYTYQAGTTTPAPTYVDSTLTTPNANPIILNFRGEANIWLPANTAFKFNVTDAAGNQIPGWPVDQIQDAVVSSITANTIGALLYPQSAAETAAGIAPAAANLIYPYGSFLRYGADPTGAADSTTAINNALACNSVVFDNFPGPALYKITGTLRYVTAGQTLKGQGWGDNNPPGNAFAPRTLIRYSGVAGGVMVSAYNGGQHYSELQLLDLVLDGNNLANICYEGYNNAVSSGCFRNVVRNVSVLNATSGVLPTGLMMGAGTANANSNDFLVDNCYVYNCNYGMRYGGATGNARNISFKSCGFSAISLTSGAVMRTTNCIFSANGAAAYAAANYTIGSDWDVTTPQLVTSIGDYYEDSVNGVYQAHTSHALVMKGARMSTRNGTLSGGTSVNNWLINLNAAAGYVEISGQVYTTSCSFELINENPGYEASYLCALLHPQSGYRVRLPTSLPLNSGIIRADNCDFLFGITSTTAAVTGNATVVNLNTFPVTVDHDLSSAVAAATGIFTAPQSGYYTFDAHVEFGSIAAGHTEGQLNLVVTGTSAQIYEVTRTNPFNQSYAGGQSHLNGTVRVFMTKNDTAYMQVEVSGGALAVTVLSSGPGLNWRTRLQGRMA